MSWRAVFLITAAIVLVVPGARSPAEELPPSERVERGQAILTVLRQRLEGLADLQFDFDEWRTEIHPEIEFSSAITGTMKLRFSDGAYRITTRRIGKDADIQQDRALLQGTVTELIQRPLFGKLVTIHNTQPSQEIGCLGYCNALLPYLAAVRPDRYPVELIGWERVGFTRCARLAVYDREAYRRSGATDRLEAYLASGNRNATPPEMSQHVWLDVKRGVALRYALVGSGKTPEGVVQVEMERTELSRLHRIDWAEGRPPLWIPAEWETQWESDTPRFGRVIGKRRLVVILSSIRTNVGFDDSVFRIPPPPGARRQSPGPDPKVAEIAAHRPAPVSPMVSEIPPGASTPLVDPDELPPPSPGQLRAPVRRGWPFTSVVLAVGGLGLLAAAWFLWRRSG